MKLSVALIPLIAAEVDVGEKKKKPVWTPVLGSKILKKIKIIYFCEDEKITKYFDLFYPELCIEINLC